MNACKTSLLIVGNLAPVSESWCHLVKLDIMILAGSEMIKKIIYTVEVNN